MPEHHSSGRVFSCSHITLFQQPDILWLGIFPSIRGTFSIEIRELIARKFSWSGLGNCPYAFIL
jgi:hypothetical protein